MCFQVESVISRTTVWHYFRLTLPRNAHARKQPTILGKSPWDT